MSRFGIRPRFIAVLLADLCVTMLVAAVWGTGWYIAIFLGGITILAAVLDCVFTPGSQWFSAQRILPAFEQNQQAEIQVLLRSKGPDVLRLRLADTPPDSFRCAREPHSLVLRKQAGTVIYTAQPTLRGVFSFGDVYLEVEGRWGFSVRRFALRCEDTAAVYPNLAPMRHYRMLAERRQLFREDAAIHKISGIGTEFVGIREYAPDDDWSKVNWKATARAGRLMTNIYDAEKNREVILAVDTGRWMQAATGGVTRLDRALELAAALMQVALSSGDRVGLVLYDARVSCYLAPDKGTVHTRKILQALYEARPGGTPSSLAALSGLLRQRLSRRAFVCVLTYLDNPQEATLAAEELAPVRRRHSLHIASLADEGLEALITKEAAQPGDVYLKAAAAYRKLSVSGAVDVLRRHGIGAHAAEPGELLTCSVRYYLKVKGQPM